MTGSEKLKHWREQVKIISQKGLAAEINRFITAEYPDGVPSGAKVFQSDIAEAEQAISPFKFRKVSDAVCKYYNLPEGYFGEFTYHNQGESISIVSEQRQEYLQKSLDLSDKLIKANEESSRLRDENYRLQKIVWELEAKLAKFEGKE